jgi:hypothetical protein
VSYKVHVTGEWRSTATFEFDDEQEAVAFYNAVHGGSLDPIVDSDQDELDTSNAELVNWDATAPREVRR